MDAMELALAEARSAAAHGEIPVGAVVLGADGAVLALAGNRVEVDRDASAHAELLEKMESARRVIELKFLSAGEVLSDAVEGIGALLTALDDLTGALDPAAIAATAQSMASRETGGLTDELERIVERAR